MSKPTKRTIHLYEADGNPITMERKPDSNFYIRDHTGTVLHSTGFKAWGENWLRKNYNAVWYMGRQFVMEYKERKRL